MPDNTEEVMAREYDILPSPNRISYTSNRVPPALYLVSGDNVDHFHANDRARANHTGTQVMATISDLPVLASGVWTPTLTNTTNVAASTTYEGQYIRVGSVVTVSGKVDIDPTAAAATELEISLPIASNLGATEDCAGTACGLTTVTSVAAILGQVTNNTASLQYTATDTGNKSFYYTFTYSLI